VFFVAGGGGLSFPFNAGTGTSTSTGGMPTVGDPAPNVDLPPLEELLLLAGVVVAVVILFALVVWAIGSVMEFVFVEALRSETVRVRSRFRQHFRPGLRLFGFRLVVSLLTLGVVLGVGAAIAFGVLGGAPLSWGPAQALAFLALFVPVFFVVFLIHALFLGFTTVFVVPVMLLEDRGVLSAWRRFWPTLRANLGSFAAYVGLAFLLQLAVGIASSIVIGVVAVAVLIPFGIVGGIVFAVGGGTLAAPVVAVLALLALVYLVIVLTAAALVAVPVQTFLRYYALFVLGDIDAEFDVVPEVRARVREDGSTPPTAG
jgi:hypothetical protein